MDPQKTSDADDEAEMAATHWEMDVDQQDPEVDIAAIVAELEGKPTESLPPVYDAVDSLITQLFSDPPPAEAQVMIQFTYHGYRIDIQQSGVMTVMDVSDPDESRQATRQRVTILLLGGKESAVFGLHGICSRSRVASDHQISRRPLERISSSGLFH